MAEPKAYCPRCRRITPHSPIGFDPEHKTHVAECKACGALNAFKKWEE